MIVIVSTIVPPEHSGAGKRIYGFYEYLKGQGYEANIITQTASSDDAIIIKRLSVNLPRKLCFTVDFFKAFVKIAHNFFLKKRSKNHIKAVWLVSCTPLTMAAVTVFYLLGYRIITQNTLVGSDDPEYKYPGDFLGIKFKLKRLQYYLSDCITSNSKELYNISQKFHSSCVMIPNPVDTKFQAKQHLLKNFHKPTNVLFVGEIGLRKGADIVLRVINLIHQIDPTVRFTFVGPIAVADKQVNELFLNLPFLNKTNIIFKGFQLDPAPYFAEADIYFMPSRREGFPTVFIEAMASGLPVVARKLDGITDYIFGNDYTTILDTEDPESYAKKILTLIANSDLYNSLSKQGLILVKRFEKKRIYQKYIEVITQ